MIKRKGVSYSLIRKHFWNLIFKLSEMSSSTTKTRISLGPAAAAKCTKRH